MDQDIEDKTYFARDHLRTGEQQDKYLNRKDQSTDMLFQMNKADKLAYDKQFDKTGQPLIINSSKVAGSTTNQTQVYAAEPATDHNDMTAKHLSDAMSA